MFSKCAVRVAAWRAVRLPGSALLGLLIGTCLFTADVPSECAEPGVYKKQRAGGSPLSPGAVVLHNETEKNIVLCIDCTHCTSDIACNIQIPLKLI